LFEKYRRQYRTANGILEAAKNVWFWGSTLAVLQCAVSMIAFGGGFKIGIATVLVTLPWAAITALASYAVRVALRALGTILISNVDAAISASNFISVEDGAKLLIVKDSNGT
jgi:hypothetical protein